MLTYTKTIEQGGLLRLRDEELPVIQEILTKRGMTWDCLDIGQKLVRLPQQYVGYIGFPSRKIIIKSKHQGVTLGHILRIYFFLYSAEHSDLDTPMYDIDTGDDADLEKMFISEMLDVVHQGLPVDYVEQTEDIEYVRGNISFVSTTLNIKCKKKEAFRCTYDDLTRETDINKVMLAAAKKIESKRQTTDIAYIIRQFGNIDYTNYSENANITKQTMYCKKAIALAYMILNDMTISQQGNNISGESLLINFDRVFERFVQKILMEYSAMGKFSYWTNERGYALFHGDNANVERSYIPDLLYDYQEYIGKPTAHAILDMKNKQWPPFHNPDVYQMAFYGQMLNCKKIILCYPCGEPIQTRTLSFYDEKFFLEKIYAAFIIITGNTAREFKENINTFIKQVEFLL